MLPALLRILEGYCKSESRATSLLGFDCASSLLDGRSAASSFCRRFSPRIFLSTKLYTRLPSVEICTEEDPRTETSTE